jgi:hypothetical protein
MDTNSLEAVPPEPLITVEPASGPDRGPDWAHAQNIAPRPVAVPGRCPHRVRVRDLKTSKKIVFVLTVPLICASALLGFAGLLFSVLMTIMGLTQADPALFIIGSILVFVTSDLVLGFVACLRVWRSLHRPRRLVCVLSAITPLIFLALLAFMVIGGGPAWVLLFAVPPAATMIVLWYFRAVLYYPSTCGYHPWLPEKILQMIET